jgi:hypothetical protein
VEALESVVESSLEFGTLVCKKAGYIMDSLEVGEKQTRENDRYSCGLWR